MKDRYGNIINIGDKVLVISKHDLSLHPAIFNYTSIEDDTENDSDNLDDEDENKMFFSFTDYVDTRVSRIGTPWCIFTNNKYLILECNFDYYFLELLSKEFSHMRATQVKDKFILYPGTNISEDVIEEILEISHLNLCKLKIGIDDDELVITLSKII